MVLREMFYRFGGVFGSSFFLSLGWFLSSCLLGIYLLHFFTLLLLQTLRVRMGLAGMQRMIGDRSSHKTTAHYITRYDDMDWSGIGFI